MANWVNGILVYSGPREEGFHDYTQGKKKAVSKLPETVRTPHQSADSLRLEMCNSLGRSEGSRQKGEAQREPGEED